MPTALITGASSGIGRSFAREFARNGFDVVLTARRQDRLDELAAEVRGEFGVEATVLVADLTRPEAPQALIDQIDGAGLQIDALVNNAGFVLAGAFTTPAWTKQRDLLQILVVAPSELTYRLLPAMVERRRGHIINVASIAGLVPCWPGGVYGSAKSYLIAFSLYLHLEYRRSGVHVTAVCPGFTDTELFDRAGTHGRTGTRSGLFWSTADAVAANAYRAVLRNDLLEVTGWPNRLVTGITRHLPYRFLALLLGPTYRYRPAPRA